MGSEQFPEQLDTLPLITGFFERFSHSGISMVLILADHSGG
jgi:hypothetical protein